MSNISDLLFYLKARPELTISKSEFIQKLLEKTKNYL